METTRHTGDPEAAKILRRARERRGWSVRQAARELGTVHSYVLALENATRRPSTAFGEVLIGVYRLSSHQASKVRAVALPDVGRAWRRECGCGRTVRCSEHVFT